MITIENIIDQVKKYNPQANIGLIKEAYEFAAMAHAGVKRHSGQDYVQHCLATAFNLAKMNMDVPSIVAGLLHDVPEDTSYSLEDIKKKFGKEVGQLVKGITKLGTLKYRGMERYAENLRKMFLAMAEDIRVIIIKFADRIHNLETLEYVRPDKRKRIALETMEIYAPIANRLGMGEMKGTLEDLAFAYVYPKEYIWIKNAAESKLRIEIKFIDRIKKVIQKELQQNKINYLSIHGRVKHLASLYKKIVNRDRDIDKIYDLIALRIVVNSVADCYTVLGLIHKKWKPLKGRIKDYIAQPKPNGYQSLHTTVFAEKGKIVEFQIRSKEMHNLAEFGIAAHWHYKDTNGKKMAQEKTNWINNLLEIQKKFHDNQKYLTELKFEIFQNRIFVFTPKGDVIDLPEDSTPIDFAYHIHTDIGNKCSGALINEEIATLDTPLKSGDVLEILTNKNRQKPNEDWLNFVKTNAAKEKIKQELKKDKNSKILNLLNRNKS